MVDKAVANVAKPEIEISPEMVEAGVQYLWDSGRLERDVPGSDHLLVQGILEAALNEKLCA